VSPFSEVDPASKLNQRYPTIPRYEIEKSLQDKEYFFEELKGKEKFIS